MSFVRFGAVNGSGMATHVARGRGAVEVLLGGRSYERGSTGIRGSRLVVLTVRGASCEDGRMGLGYEHKYDTRASRESGWRSETSAVERRVNGLLRSNHGLNVLFCDSSHDIFDVRATARCRDNGLGLGLDAGPAGDLVGLLRSGYVLQCDVVGVQSHVFPAELFEIVVQIRRLSPGSLRMSCEEVGKSSALGARPDRSRKGTGVSGHFGSDPIRSCGFRLMKTRLLSRSIESFGGIHIRTSKADCKDRGRRRSPRPSPKELGELGRALSREFRTTSWFPGSLVGFGTPGRHSTE